MDINPEHFGTRGNPHPAYITAKCGHKYKANSITHSRTIKGVKNYLIDENPDKRSSDKRKSRISQPFWQNERQFSKSKLKNFRFSKQSRSKIKKFNKKFK